jgi:hypothetical protein
LSSHIGIFQRQNKGGIGIGKNVIFKKQLWRFFHPGLVVIFHGKTKVTMKDQIPMREKSTSLSSFAYSFIPNAKLQAPSPKPFKLPA